MMKMKFVVQHRPHSDTRLALKPLDCGLHGIAVYDNLPKRAMDQLPGGAIVEATINLPDQYPVSCSETPPYETPLGRLILGSYDVEKGRPLTEQPQYEYWEVRQVGAALPYATFFDNPLLPQSKLRAIEYARELEAEYARKQKA
jgi:hypothetical protein